ncbi:DUF4350 domain-containing protein [Specibacter sp. AOP5-B1-6]|uniref:DUF4350 domain-containing protein n=1 Tax=Specibacter sp. AOP5-B1-6 TaxID=3457653 RepID=UPI003FB8366A
MTATEQAPPPGNSGPTVPGGTGAAGTDGGAVFRAEHPSAPKRAGRWWRQHKFWLVCAAIFVVLSLLGIIVGSSGERSSGTLSITNPAPAGAQAAASVLRNQGVSVTATDSLADTTHALAANGPGNSTVLFYDPNNLLTPDKAAALSAAVQGSGGKLVAVAPGPLTTKKFSPDLASTGTAAGTASAAARCNIPAALAAETIDGGAPALGAASATVPLRLYKGAETCFSPSGKTTAGGYLAGNSSGDIAVLGNPGVVINQNLANRGNAALTFGLLGSTPNLLWYTVSVKDIPVAEQQQPLSDFMPEWVFPASAWLLIVALLGMFWRGRRNGPLVTEPLPVIVKASETLSGRARLYQNARAVDTAARTLQHATLTRLARKLRLGISAEPAAVVEAVVAVSGRKHQEVHALLLGEAPQTEKDMLSMAVELTALEEEVAKQ